MPKAVLVTHPGGPEVFEFKELAVAKLKPGEVLIRHTAIGLNFLDIYHRTGLYPLPAFPAVIGVEACGVVEEISKGVNGLKLGDRVAYCTAPPGAYCEYRPVNQDYLVKVPKSMTDEQAAACMVKGLTAYYLLHKTCKVKRGDFILVHAAAGGVGQLLCQWGKHLGAKVIGTVGSEEKIKAVTKIGCANVVNYRQENFAKKIMEITNGKGVKIAYDSVGKDTIIGSLESLADFGMLVSFGQSSGKIPDFDISLLAKKSLFMTRPSLFTYMKSREQLEEGAEALFSSIAKGITKINIARTYQLKEAATAHRDLESRKIIGSAVLLP